MADKMPRTHPRHEGGPCPAYDPDSRPGKGPKEVRAEMGIPEPKRPAT